MTEIVKTIMEYGILLVIAGVFLWDKVTISKSTVTILSRLESQAGLLGKTLDGLHHSVEGVHTSNENTSTALNIIQNTLASNLQDIAGINQALERHDKRAEYMNTDVRAILDILRIRPGVVPMPDSLTREIAAYKPEGQ